MKQLHIILAIILLLCLTRMPYGYYALVRFVATAGFTFIAYRYHEMKKEGLTWTFGVLALLFQPLVKFPLGRDIWNIVDVVVAIFLIILMFTKTEK